MRSAPIPPAEYDGEHLDTDDKLRAEGYAAGMDVWEQVGKGYTEHYLRDGILGNAQLWSLEQAIRADERGKLLNLIESLTDPDDCSFDHHGGCQAHGYLSLEPGEKCPQAEAKELIEASKRERAA